MDRTERHALRYGSENAFSYWKKDNPKPKQPAKQHSTDKDVEVKPLGHTIQKPLKQNKK